MNATLETRFTVTLPGLIAAADIAQRIEPTQAGRAYVACAKAEEDLNDACGEVQQGAPYTSLEGPQSRLNAAVNDFYALTGQSFYSTDADYSAGCSKDAGRE